MTFVGFNLHKRYIMPCMLSDHGPVVAECRQLTTGIVSIREWLPALATGSRTPWKRPSIGNCSSLNSGVGIPSRVAHALHVKLIRQIRSKTDPIDARKIAGLIFRESLNRRAI